MSHMNAVHIILICNQYSKGVVFINHLKSHINGIHLIKNVTIVANFKSGLIDHKDRKTHTDMQTNRQTDTHTDIHTNTQTYTQT